MSGAPASSMPIFADKFVAVMIGLAVSAALGLIGVCSYSIGAVHVLDLVASQEIYTCTKHEDRTFVDTGFLIFSGSGEMTVHNICVEWSVKRQ